MIKRTFKRAILSLSPQSLFYLSALAVGGISTPAASQDVHFDFDGAGENKAMTHWGVDTAWPNPDNVRQTIYHMGLDQTDVVRINFFMDEPLGANGEIGAESKARIDAQLELAQMAKGAPLALTPATGEDWDDEGPGQGPTHPYYLDDDGNAIPERWMALMEATQEYIGEPIHALEVFNEPDYWLGMGTTETLREIMLLVETSPNFEGAELHAASTLCSCAAQHWYDAVSDVATHGTLHQLSGSSNDYINFIQHVQNQGDIAYNPELHSMAEVLYGTEYGMQGGIWWADALRPRGVLVNAVQGDRLGYAELRWTDSAAAVYRAPDGEVYGFAGSFERNGPNKSYRYVSDDQDVYFNGIGPLREFMMPTWADQQGGFFHIDNAPGFPALDGHRWKLVNRATGEVLEVEGGSTENGANLRTATDNGGSHQKWDIDRTRDGYYGLVNAGTGKAADDYGWSLEDGGNIAQWDNYRSLNQVWWIEPHNNGFFYLHNGHSNLYLESEAGNVQQGDFSGRKNQQWSFVPADPAVRGSLTAHYEFEGSANDSTANGHNGSPIGGASYEDDQPLDSHGHYLDLKGGWDWWGDHLELPDNIANTEDITVATWVYWEGGANWQRIFDFGVDSDRYMFLSPSGDGQMKFAITTRSWWDEQSLVTAELPQNRWVHVAVTLGGNTAKLYIDGQLQVAGHIFKNPSDVYDVPVDYWDQNWTQNNFIGRSQWPDPTFNGAIDDFRIYDYALDASEIATLLPEVTLLEDSFEGNFVKWANYDANYWDNPDEADVETGGWNISSTEWVSGRSSAHANMISDGLTSNELDASGRTSISIQFWYRDSGIENDKEVALKLYNGRKWKEAANLADTDPEDTWHFFHTTVTDPQFLISNLRIKFEAESMATSEHLYIDDVRVTSRK